MDINYNDIKDNKNMNKIIKNITFQKIFLSDANSLIFKLV
jgi:hypothetical protein